MLSKIPIQWVPTAEDEEAILLCPICESPPDYCQDHHHYLCEECEAPLDLDSQQEYWECSECDAYENPDDVLEKINIEYMMRRI